MTPIGDVINLAIERLIAKLERRDNVVPFPVTTEMRVRLALRRQVEAEREAR